MTITINTYSTIASPRFKYLVTAGQLYRISQINGTTSVTNTRTNNRQSFYSAESFEHFIDTLTAAGNRIAAEWRVASLIFYMARNPQPLPPVIASVAAASEPKMENIIRVPQSTVGEYYDVESAADLSAAFEEFTARHGVEPNLIKIHSKHITECRSTMAVEYTRTDSVQRGKVAMLYTPAVR